MQVLPEGFALPPLPYLLALLVALGLVAWGFTRRRLAVTERHIVALATWMVVGSVLYVLHSLRAFPTALQYLTGTPAVYLSVAVVAGAVWLAADAADLPVPETLATTGILALLPTLGYAVVIGLDRGTFRPLWAVVITVVSVVVAAVAWVALRRAVPEVAVTGGVGALAVFGHTLDGVSTAIGLDALGFHEQTPASRFIIELGNSLPTAQYVGGGWLFVVVKVLVASLIVYALAGYVRDEPTEGYLLLGLVAAVGLGPGAHNLVLFTVA